MIPSEKPRVRLVVYVSESVYNEINLIAEAENRSISSIAERKIVAGLGIKEDNNRVFRHSQAQSGTAQIPIIDSSEKDPLANISEESLTRLAEKLQRIIQSQNPVSEERSYPPNNSDPVRHVPAQSGTAQINTSDRMEMFHTQDLAKRLNGFVIANGITHREFKNKYGFDISQITRWISGKRGMSFEIIQKVKQVLGDTGA